jgi:hypothetical protein
VVECVEEVGANLKLHFVSEMKLGSLGDTEVL